MPKRTVRRLLTAVSALSLPGALLFNAASPAGASAPAAQAAPAAPATTSGLGTYAPTYVGPAATGCASGCSLMTGPFPTKAITPSAAGTPAATSGGSSDTAKTVPMLRPARGQAPAGATSSVAIPVVSCVPARAGCDSISQSSGGATGVKGIDAVDSARRTTNIYKDVEPPDQALCAGNGYVLEANNIGEMLVFNSALKRQMHVISLDRVMGLYRRGWSSGGDPSCVYDYGNGGHWIITEFVSASPEKSGGAFTGCFAAVANSCHEAIAVTTGNDPFGPYNVYFLNADYNPSEPGAPYLLNDFTKTAVSRDAFLLFYDEFPLNPGVAPGFGGGGFNGAQEFAIDKNALEMGRPVLTKGGKPNPYFTVAIENMGLLPTPDGTCASDNRYHEGGVTCWYSVIPVQPPDPSQYDNANGGTAFMMNTLDFYGLGDNRLAVWAWTGLHGLDSAGCSACTNIKFSGQLFSGVQHYYGEGFLASQKTGPIPLGRECGAAGLSTRAHCPENGIATNGDNITEASQAQGQLWAAISTEVDQVFGPSAVETHQDGAYWVIGTSGFDHGGNFTLTSQSYVAPAHEDLSMPAMAAEGTSSDGGNGLAILAFTLTGNGGPTGADGGGFYPSTAYGRLSATSNGLLGSMVNVADLGRAPQDGFTEYQGYPGATRPRWGDYSAATFVPNTGGTIYFANEYIPYPACGGSKFTLTIGTCGGTRDGLANWGTSVNSVVP